MGHQERGVLDTLHVPDTRRGRCGSGSAGSGGLFGAERRTSASAPLVSGSRASQRAYPAVGAAVPVRGAANSCDGATTQDTRYTTGPCLHLHEAGLIATSRWMGLLLHVDQASRGQMVMVRAASDLMVMMKKKMMMMMLLLLLLCQV